MMRRQKQRKRIKKRFIFLIGSISLAVILPLLLWLIFKLLEFAFMAVIVLVDILMFIYRLF
ncbi:hypothetical protein ACQKIY_25375 [Bacillus mycoides]|uniref:hypothetical protein n=1 Tax=Bacillus mycoides TaxID=1405 RepID=UPI003D008644